MNTLGNQVSGVNQQKVEKDEMVNVDPPKGMKKALSPEGYPHWHQVVWKELLGLFNMGCISYAERTDPMVRKHGELPSHFVFASKFD